MGSSKVRVVVQVVGVGTDVYQIVSRVEDLTEYQCYCVEYLGNLVFDDLVWHQCIVSLERLQTFCGGLRADPNNSVFWNLLMRGVLDLEPEECQGHSTLHSHVLDGVLRLAIPNRDFLVGCP